MMTMWKFEVPVISEYTEIDMPIGARIVHVGTQNSDRLTFWAMVDMRRPTERRTFKVFGTGREFATDWLYVGSILMEPFVWHLLELNTTG